MENNNNSNELEKIFSKGVNLNVPYSETRKILDKYTYKVTDEDMKQADEDMGSQEM
jgi:hypothetical protein